MAKHAEGSRVKTPSRLRFEHLGSEIHRRAAAGTAWNLLGTGSARTATLVGTVFLTHLLGASGFGGLSLAQTTIVTLATVSGLGLSLAITRFMSQGIRKDPASAGQFLTTGILSCIVSGAVFSLALVCFGHEVAESILGNRTLASALQIGAPTLLFSPLADCLIAALGGAQAFRLVGFAQATRGVLDVALLLIGAASWGVAGALAGYVLAEAASCALVTLLLTRAQRLGQVPSFGRATVEVMRRILKFAGPSLTTALLIQATIWIGQIILGREAGLAAVGVFVYCTRFYLVVSFLPQVMGNVFFPMLTDLYNSARHEFTKLLRTYVAFSVGVSLVPAATLFFAAKAVLLLKATPNPQEVETLQVLIGTSIFTVLNSVLGQAAVAIDRIYWWLLSDVALAIALLATALWLVPSRGTVGLALAYLAGYGCTCIAILPAFRGELVRGLLPGIAKGYRPRTKRLGPRC